VEKSAGALCRKDFLLLRMHEKRPFLRHALMSFSKEQFSSDGSASPQLALFPTNLANFFTLSISSSLDVS
jgi:hypothetical protein